jgi:hypothetical protein
MGVHPLILHFGVEHCITSMFCSSVWFYYLSYPADSGHFFCRYCARLIQAAGGNSGSIDLTTKKTFQEEIESVSLSDIRAKVDQLFSHGYSKRSTVWKSEEELLCEFETSVILSAKVCEAKIKLDDVADGILQRVSGIKNVMISFSNELIPYLSSLPSKSKNISHLQEKINLLLQDLDNSQVKSNEDVLDHLNSLYQIDSDEEAKLFDDIDVMMDTQERAESFKGNTKRFLANSVDSTFRRIFDLENAFRLVRKK